MLTYLIVLQEMPSGGVAIDQIPISKPAEATPLERTVGGILDIANRIAGEFVAKNSASGKAIEGKDIEEYVSKVLDKEHLVNFRKALVDMGFELP